LTLPTVEEKKDRRPEDWKVQGEAAFPLPDSKPPFERTWVGVGATVEVRVEARVEVEVEIKVEIKVEVVRVKVVMVDEGVLDVTDLGVGEELLSMELDAGEEVLEAVLETLTTDEEVARADDVDKTTWLEVEEATLAEVEEAASVETRVEEEADDVAEAVTRAKPESN
jgi:hypothetical protein